VARAKKHTIIGNSAAGLSAVKAIRRMGDPGPIVLISAENCNAYSPVLTTHYIAGEIRRSDLFLVDDSFYKSFKVQTMFGRRAAQIDPAHHLVYLDNGSKVDYDNLLIASGASPKLLDNVDVDASEYVSTLRTIADAERIIKACEEAKEVVITGAGLVSLQIIKAILGRGMKITAVVGSQQVLSQQMDPEGAAMIQEKLEARGVSILFGRGVERVIRKDDRAHVITSFSEALPADLVVVGKGVQPNTNMVKGTGIKVNNGIVVDERMRTNLEDVFAAGDVAEGKNAITGKMEVIATWLNACAQGEIAGLNMAGFPSERQGQFRENVTTILGVAVASIGLFKPEEGQFREIRYVDLKRGVYRKLSLDGPRVVGALLVGKIEDAGVIRHCIANEIDVSPWEDKMAMTPLDFGSILCGHDFRWPLFTS
jgi:nitrite reductase (NADH) large subunit